MANKKKSIVIPKATYFVPSANKSVQAGSAEEAVKLAEVSSDAEAVEAVDEETKGDN